MAAWGLAFLKGDWMFLKHPNTHGFHTYGDLWNGSTELMVAHQQLASENISKGLLKKPT